MRKQKAVNAEEIVILSYWPLRKTGEEHIGFGIPRNYLFYQLMTMPLSVVMDWFIRPRLLPLSFSRARPTSGRWINFALLMPFLIGILFIPASRRTGFYILDEQGKARVFLRRWFPPFLKWRIGVSRKQFLAQAR